MGSSHQHGSRSTLATYITDAEEQFAVTYEIVKQVATHLSGRHQQTGHIHILNLHVTVGQHTLLNMTCHTQLRTDTFLLGISLMQTLQITFRTPNDKAGQQQTRHNQQQQTRSNITQFAENIVFVQYINKYPVSLSTHRSEKHYLLRTIFILQYHMSLVVAIIL